MSCEHSLKWGLVMRLSGVVLGVVGYGPRTFMPGGLVGVCLRV